MRARKYVETLNFKISSEQSNLIRSLADRDKLSVGEVARSLLADGMKARGLIA